MREERRDGAVILTVSGKLDAVVEEQATLALDAVIEGTSGLKLILDLGGVQVIDSSGVSVVAEAYKKLRQRGGQMKVACLAEQPGAIFRMLRLDRSLAVCQTVDEAIAQFAR